MSGVEPDLGLTAVGPVCHGGPAMAQYQPTLYDRVLDWFSDHRMTIAKGVVLVAVFAMVGGLLVGALAGLTG